MSITIKVGKSGRLVVPKAIRDRLGLQEGSLLSLEIQGGMLQAVPAPDPVEVDLKGGFPVIRSGASLKRGDVVEAIKSERDSRDARVGSGSKSK